MLDNYSVSFDDFAVKVESEAVIFILFSSADILFKVDPLLCLGCCCTHLRARNSLLLLNAYVFFSKFEH